MIGLVAAVTLRELARRRAALALVLLLPLVFYLVRLEMHWTALRLLAIGLGWAVATLALFTQVSARSLDWRLVVAGASPTALQVGRQLAVVLLGMAVGLAYFVLVALTVGDDLERLAPVLLLLVVTVLVAAPLGALVAAVVPRDLEGAMLLLAVMAVQILVDPADGWTRVLPMWSTRELATYAVEPVDTAYLTRGLVHGLVAMVALAGASLAVSAARLRTRPVPEPAGVDLVR